MISFFRAHKRVSVITFAWVAFCAFVLIPNWREGPFYFLFFSTLFVTLIASQLFWIPRVVDLGERFIPGKPRRAWLTAIASDGFLDGRPHDARRSAGLPQKAQGCGRPRRRSHAWCHSS